MIFQDPLSSFNPRRKVRDIVGEVLAIQGVDRREITTDIRSSRRLALIFISHDLAVVRHISDRVAVMYMGKIAEIGGAHDVFTWPAHPYTRKLLEAAPIPDARVKLRGVSFSSR